MVKKKQVAACSCSCLRRGSRRTGELRFEPTEPGRPGGFSRYIGTRFNHYGQKKSRRLPAHVHACGEGGIRTHGTREGSTVFETARFNHSRTSPACIYSSRKPAGWGKEALPLPVAERVGFEPTVRRTHTRFPVAPIQPLSHLSEQQIFQKSRQQFYQIKTNDASSID
jgi:hypothetical protein